jgi:hypothetical protein
MSNFFLLTIGSILTGALFSSCSHPSATTDSTDISKNEASVTTRTQISRVDSLNGIPGHRFGEPLSAFPGIVLAKSQQPGTQTYTYPEGKPEGGWFGKHKKGDLFVFYVFKDNKFLGFQALAFGNTRAALQEETLFLLGPGQKGAFNTSWVGEKTQAFYTPKLLPKGAAEILDIQSLSLVQAQANESNDRLKRENAGQ